MPSAADDTILLATRSADKLREIRVILGDVGMPIITLADAGLEPLPEEDDVEAFDTFLANAHAKAAYFARRSGMAVIADDSGISVDALDGAPGVRSKRFAAAHDAAAAALDGAALDQANNETLLRRLQHVRDADRRAHYTCAAVIHLPDGRRLAALGSCAGTILDAPRGTHGFGYDPLFLDPASGLAFAEMEPHAKNGISHRSRAFRALAGTASRWRPHSH
ncbi:RdgB/HAM1 family non-canonical purine NTP pyrophosphatase [soil metagenome]